MSNTTSSSKLFQPLKVGDITLNHRVVMAPLTRFRGTETHAPGPLAAEYYAQRSDAPGTLLITEGTLIAERAGSYFGVPGIWSDEQIAGWKKIVDTIHKKGSFVYLQLWALGRTADVAQIKLENSANDLVGASAIALAEHATPRPLTVTELKEYAELFATAASNAVHKAGFDGVEIHGANGYLIDQFLQDVTNQRTDIYGGSVENRSRFALEVVDAVVAAVGAPKTAIRLSPWGTFQGMGMADSEPQFAHVISQIKARHPHFAYIHIVGPRVDGSTNREAVPAAQVSQEARLHALWAPKPIVNAGGLDRETALEIVDKEEGGLVAFGRFFISNPDLVCRLKENIPLAKGDRNTYYVPKGWGPEGYTDYPFADGSIGSA